jgi:hypothetical protein
MWNFIGQHEQPLLAMLAITVSLVLMVRFIFGKS